MSNASNKPVLVTATLAGGLLLAGSAFAATPLAQGYMLGAQDAATATEAKTKEGGCGAKKAEGSCGMDKMDTDKDGKISSAEFGAAHGGDTSKFAEHDPNGDGFIDAAEMDAHHAATKADKAGTAKADMEGKCGEGACGGSR
ncbi:MAG: EF-hand domain-containing protein [Lysobacter sp.]